MPSAVTNASLCALGSIWQSVVHGAVHRNKPEVDRRIVPEAPLAIKIAINASCPECPV